MSGSTCSGCGMSETIDESESSEQEEEDGQQERRVTERDGDLRGERLVKG